MSEVDGRRDPRTREGGEPSARNFLAVTSPFAKLLELYGVKERLYPGSGGSEEGGW